MAKAEAARPDGIDAVAIVTPNHMHAGPTIAFLNAGINVICDKPPAATQEDAAAIQTAVAASKAKFILTHNYTGYPLMRQAREMIACGDLGRLRVIQAEYAQDRLTEGTQNKQADWRTDSNRSGAGAIGDIGPMLSTCSPTCPALRRKHYRRTCTVSLKGDRLMTMRTSFCDLKAARVA